MSLETRARRGACSHREKKQDLVDRLEGYDSEEEQSDSDDYDEADSDEKSVKAGEMKPLEEQTDVQLDSTISDDEIEDPGEMKPLEELTDVQLISDEEIEDQD